MLSYPVDIYFFSSLLLKASWNKSLDFKLKYFSTAFIWLCGFLSQDLRTQPSNTVYEHKLC